MAKDDDKSKDTSSENEESTNTTKSTTFTEAETKAREMGHRSKDEWVAEGKDADAWVDAGEFLRRAPLYEAVHKANRTNKDLSRKLDKLVQHQEELVRAKVEQEIARLQSEKKQAAKEHDVERVVAIQDKIDEVKEKAKETKADTASSAAEAKQAFEDWQDENKWYREDEDMRAYANGYGHTLEKKYEDDAAWTPERILAEVAKKTKKVFEWKFKNPNREAPNKVGTTKTGSNEAASGGNGKLPSYNDLPKEAQDLYKEFVKTAKNPRGFMTAEQYLTQYAQKAGLIKEEG